MKISDNCLVLMRVNTAEVVSLYHFPYVEASTAQNILASFSSEPARWLQCYT